MKRRTRLIIYFIVGVPIPVISQLMYPGEYLWEVLAFMGAVVVAGTVIELTRKE